MVLAIQPALVHAHVLIGTATTPAVRRYSPRFVPRHVLRPELLGSAFAGYLLAACCLLSGCRLASCRLAAGGLPGSGQACCLATHSLTTAGFAASNLAYPPSINSSSQHVHRTRREPKSGN